MRRIKRSACLLLACALLALLAPQPRAVGTLIFTAVNEKLYPLGDDTMPFWSGGMIYVPQTALVDNSLEIYYNRNREKQRISLYQLRSGLIFDLTTGYAELRDGSTVYAPLIQRGDTFFFPLTVLCPVFGLEYSYTRVTYGYLLRIKNGDVRLNDLQYIDAAASAMATRYEQYMRTHEENSTPPAPPSQTEAPRPETPRTVYLAVEATSEAYAGELLDALPEGCAAFLIAPRSIPALAALARRLATGAGAAVLRIDASAGAEDALRRIAEGNRALWAAANMKTRLVCLDGADEETEGAVREAGYCPLRFAADYSDSYPSVARMCARIFAAADGAGGSCCVFLGADESLSRILSPLLSALHEGNCTPARLNELTAR